MSSISVIILTFNSRQYIKPCLESLSDQQCGDIEIIVIDNGSQDGTVDFIKASYPKARLIANKENLGASKARNQGIEAASGEWILTLDCDVVLEEGFIDNMMEFAGNLTDSIGMIQPKILTKDKKMIYSCGIGASWLGRFYDIGRGLADRQKFNNNKRIFGACCAAALYRRKMLQSIKDACGYFDERFFFLFEDADLSWRGQKKHWGCMYYPQAICLHNGNSSSTDKRTRQWLSFRNRQLMILKNQHFAITLLMLPLYLAYDLPRLLMFAVKFKCKFPKF